jgi:hypothetical protein
LQLKICIEEAGVQAEYQLKHKICLDGKQIEGLQQQRQELPEKAGVQAEEQLQDIQNSTLIADCSSSSREVGGEQKHQDIINMQFRHWFLCQT